jgi:hypothetical protein
MKTLQFEGVKIALKQDKNGYVLTLGMHPDDAPEDLLRDFVGARYQVVMVRLNLTEEPLDRQQEFEGDRAVRIAGMLCRNPKFWGYLADQALILEASEEEATEYLRHYLEIQSRSELKTNDQARIRLDALYKEFQIWEG